MAKRRRKARKSYARRRHSRRRMHGLGQMDMGAMDMGAMEMGAMHDSEMPMMAGLGQFDREEGMSTGMKLLIGAAVVGAGYYFFMRKSEDRKIELAVSAPGLVTGVTADSAATPPVAAVQGVDQVIVTPVLKVNGVEKTAAKFKVKEAFNRAGVVLSRDGNKFVISKSTDTAAPYSAGADLEFVIVEDDSSVSKPAEQKVSIKLGQMNWDTQTLMGLGSMAQYRYAGGGGGIYTAPRGGADYYGGRGYTYGSSNPFAAG